MPEEDLEAFYRRYIDCLNAQDWTRLEDFVGADLHYNGRRIGVCGYQAMLENNFVDIPDLRFVIDLLMTNTSYIGARLMFNCSPRGEFLGAAVNGKLIEFSENVFYQLLEGKIGQVWSVIDKVAIEAQL